MTDKFIFETEMSKSFFYSKYLLENEIDPEQALERVLGVVIKYYPELVEELRKAIARKWVGLAGGIWRSALNPMKNVSAINCTTLDQPEDTLESIAEAQYWWQKFSAYGQGEGVDLSKLRPRGAKVHNTSRTSTGAVSFMRGFDALLDNIAQEGRRGASLISLNIKHPDIPEFITVKDEEGVLESANISIQITDDFMKAVEEDKEWEFVFINKYETIRKRTSAKKLFYFIAEHTWKSGDPGLQFIDTAKKYSNSDYLGYPVVSTNAPVPGDTLVPTKNGLIPIRKLYEAGNAEVIYNDISEQNKKYLNVNFCSSSKKAKRHNNNACPIKATFKKYENQKKYNIYLKNGKILESNGEHKWLTNHGMIEAKNIVQDDYIFYNEIGTSEVFGFQKDENSEEFKEGAVIGWIVGDGWLGNNYSGVNNSLTEHKNVGIVWKDGEERIKNLFLDKFKKVTGRELNYVRDRGTSYYLRTSNKIFYDYLQENFGFDQDKYVVPDRVFTDFNFASGFLSALFDADGCISKNNKSFRIALTSTNLYIIRKVQDLLLNWYGINSTINDRSAKKGVEYTLANGEKKISGFKNAYNLCITRKNDLFKFQKYIDFLHEEKKDKLKKALESNTNNNRNKYFAIKVKHVEKTDSYEDMYCAVVPDKHAFVCNGMISSNCSEQVLDPHNVCLLSSINLAKYDEYGAEGYKRLIYLMIHLLDAFRLEEIAEHRSPSPTQHKKLQEIPRIGLGVTGLADFFIDNKLVYASDIAINICTMLFGVLAGESYKASYEIAKKNGKSFPAYDKKKYKKSPFVQRLLEEGWIEDFHLDYQAHVCKNTVAPNGTITEIVEAGGGGIEPLFAKYFVRRERATTGEWKEWFNFNHLVRKTIEKTGNVPTKELADSLQEPWWITSHNVDNIAKIKMMAEIQKYIDSAISVTYNLPEDATVEDIKEIYLEAWKYELKGVAVYREGSKTGVLITDANYEKNKNMVEKIVIPETTIKNAVKRPEFLPCDIYEMHVNKKRVIALVGLYEDRPYEVFITDDPDEVISVKHAKEGIIQKIKTGQYNLVVEGKRSKYILEDISSVFDDEWGTLSRLISMSLRHNVPLQFIISQLNKTKQFGTFSKGVARSLKKYLKEGEKAVTAGSCPECGNESLIYVSGCISCPVCGYSKCD